MAKINPKELAGESRVGGGGDVTNVGAGKKLLVAIGNEYRQINGKPVVDIRFCCVEDLEGGEDLGNELTTTFWLSPQALWNIARFALAIGFVDEFDPEVQDDLERVMSCGPVEARVKLTQRGKYTNYDVTEWSPHSLEVDPTTNAAALNQAQLDAVGVCEKRWEGYLKWRSTNPRGVGAPKSDGATGSKGGGFADDDIPF